MAVATPAACTGDLVLVVERDPSMAGLMVGCLLDAGYRVAAVSTAMDALDRCAFEEPSVVIAELYLSDLDGIEFCRRLRGWSRAAIIVVTADDSAQRKVLALDAGADDYVTKPFSMPELLARIRVAIRHGEAMAPPESLGRIEVGSLVIDSADRMATIGGRPCKLTPKEFEFLELLARHPGKLVSQQAILRQIWGPQATRRSEYLRVYASQLRKKLGIDPGAPHLVTEPRLGYRLVHQATPSEGDQWTLQRCK